MTDLVPIPEQALAEIREAWFSTAIEPSQKKDLVMATLLQEASMQVAAETDEDSPWYLSLTGHESKHTVLQRVGRCRYEVLTRAAKILHNLRTTLDINEGELLAQIQRERIELFPPDGQYQSLMDIIAEIYDGRPGSRTIAALRFNEFRDEFEAAGVSAYQVAQIIEEHSRGGNFGTSILASMATAASKVLKGDEVLTTKERKARLREIASNAMVMSVNEFETHYSERRVSSLRYDEQRDDLGGTLFVFEAKTQEQAELLRGRMRDAMVRDEGLWRPVTPSQIATAAQVGEWQELLKAAVLADRTCRVIYGMLEAAAGPCDRDYFLRYSSLAPQEVDAALAELEHWALIEKPARVGTKTLWTM